MRRVPASRAETPKPPALSMRLPRSVATAPRLTVSPEPPEVAVAGVTRRMTQLASVAVVPASVTSTADPLVSSKCACVSESMHSHRDGALRRLRGDGADGPAYGWSRSVTHVAASSPRRCVARMATRSPFHRRAAFGPQAAAVDAGARARCH